MEDEPTSKDNDEENSKQKTTGKDENLSQQKNRQLFRHFKYQTPINQKTSDRNK